MVCSVLYPMRKLFKPTLLVTMFMLFGQGLGFITQIVIAALFGADTNMDAFLAASAAPQYLMAVLIASLGVVLVPVFIDYMASGRKEEAWQIASSVINVCFVTLFALTVLGMVFPDFILRLIAPGLSDTTHSLAVKVALITWPGILAVASISLLTSIYQSQSHFGWPAAVPVLGAAVNLLLIVMFTKWWGILGLAVATTVGFVLQALLLLPIALRTGHYRLSLDLRHPGVIQIFTLLVPLLLVNLITKITPVVERFLASSMSEGSISHLNYAFRLSGVAILLFSTGITTVIFPRMAENVSRNDMAGLRHSMSSSLRYMWMAVAPAITLGIALAVPLVSAAFLRGKFNVSDTLSVASVLQIYLLSLIGACLGNITSRSFYALKDTRTIAVIGSIESLAYIFYTYYLARSFGIIGVAWGYVILFNLSFLWQVIVLRYKTGNTGGRTIISSFARVGIAAVIAGIVTWELSTLTKNMLLQLIVCGTAGMIVYIGAVFAFRVPEASVLWITVTGRTRARWPSD